MFIHVTDAEYIGDYAVRVTFNNGRTGIADLSVALKGLVFEQLQDKSLFSKLRVDEELETIVWPNGADMAPEYIYYLTFKEDMKLEPLFEEWGYISPKSASSDRHSVATHGATLP